VQGPGFQPWRQEETHRLSNKRNYETEEKNKARTSFHPQTWLKFGEDAG
jgi:hypothetical protein